MTKTVYDFYDALLKLYTLRTIDRITVTDLSQVAGYHRNTFYANFRSVDDLFDRVKNRAADEIVQQAHAVFCSHSEAESFPLELHDFDAWLKLLFERDKDSRFTDLLCDKCRPIWEDGYRSASSGAYREIEIEYRMRGTVAALSYYCRSTPGLSLHELYSFLCDLAK